MIDRNTAAKEKMARDFFAGFWKKYLTDTKISI